MPLVLNLPQDTTRLMRERPLVPRERSITPRKKTAHGTLAALAKNLTAVAVDKTEKLPVKKTILYK